MNKSIVLLICIFLYGCDAHIVQREYIGGGKSNNWNTIKGNPEVLQYSCTEFNVQYHRTKIKENEVSNSIFWLPILPNFSQKKPREDFAHIRVTYS